MRYVLKFLHITGAVMFLGSISVYLVVSFLSKGGSVEDVAFGRSVISGGTDYVTVPGLWAVTITGIAMTAKFYGFFKSRWLALKLLIGVAALLNAYLIIIPAADGALEAARASVAGGKLIPEYFNACMRESIAGAVNVILAFVAICAGVRRF